MLHNPQIPSCYLSESERLENCMKIAGSTLVLELLIIGNHKTQEGVYLCRGSCLSKEENWVEGNDDNI